ncbi:3'(2'),5'-bisphosphate nucleotidase [Fulvimarina manganoxydans]|uniref:3'(2'),5'-bisphosphate nucleotidase CysQ n=1 Tax=Fulvimarina manganoxydans TaxID=937218 RepID=A0A1W1YER0_9HYPH|nr:inositol monophosphatase family protein [Fulvimarina manganoxydans]SMC34700.1 3'(2'),5'-bisphosphate nucleotidase [Fulvimarina manganoxydans]
MQSETSIHLALAVEAVRAGMAAIQALDGDLSIERKSDRSPVTKADRAAEAAIVAILSRASNLPIVAEEAVSEGRIPEPASRFFLVDPLDGTRGYISGRADYTVNVALVDGGVPIVGAVGVPQVGDIYGGSLEEGAFLERAGRRRSLHPRKARERLTVVASRDHMSKETETYVASLAIGGWQGVGSSLKFCLLAEGRADLYPRFGRTMMWDTAAADAVLRAAGGIALGFDGRPLSYVMGDGRADPLANPDFIAMGDPSLARRPGVLPEGISVSEVPG